MFIDIGIVVILLIGLIMGIVRGTAKSIIKLVSLAGALVLTWFLTPYAMQLVFNVDLFRQLVFGDGATLKSLFEGYGSSAYTIAMIFATVIVSFLVYLVVRLLIMIIAAILKAIFLKYKPRPVSRIVGGVFGIVNAFVMVMWSVIFVSVLTYIPSLTSTLVEQSQNSIVMSWTEFVQEGYNDLFIKDDYIKEAQKEADKALGTPGDGTQTPGDGTQTPGDGTQTPGDGTQTPGDGTQTPGDGTQTPGDGTQTPGEEGCNHTGIYTCEGCGNSFVEMWEEFLTNYEDSYIMIEEDSYDVKLTLDKESGFDVALSYVGKTDTVSLNLVYNASDNSWEYIYAEGEIGGEDSKIMQGMFTELDKVSELEYEESSCTIEDVDNAKANVKRFIEIIALRANERLSGNEAGFTMANLGLNF